MKILMYVIAILLLYSCKKEDLMDFQEEKASVYFYVDKNEIQTEVVKSFTVTLDDQLVALVPVRCSGLAVSKERKFKIEVVQEGTTAKSPEDYGLLAEDYVFPADVYETWLPVRLNRTLLLQDSTLLLELKLSESDDFTTGEKLRQNVVIRFSDRLEKPGNWNNTYYRSYSRKKHQLFLILTKREIYPTPAEWKENEFYFMYVVPRQLSGYFRDNYPVKDEKGNIINPW